MNAAAPDGEGAFECEFDCGFRGPFKVVEAHESRCTCAAGAAYITQEPAPSCVQMRAQGEVELEMAVVMAECVLDDGSDMPVPPPPQERTAAQQPRHSLPSRLQALEDAWLPPSATQRTGSYMSRVDDLEMAVFGANCEGTLLERVAALEKLKMRQPRYPLYEG
jgi:hypothetical protein